MREVRDSIIPMYPGVERSNYGNTHIHLKLGERPGSPIVSSEYNLSDLAPQDTPTLQEMQVFEDCVVFNHRDGHSLVLHVTDPLVKGTVVHFYHPNGTPWRVIPLEELNPGWVLSSYLFRGDLAKFEARQARMRSLNGLWPEKVTCSFWKTGGWSVGLVYTATGIVKRIKSWQHSDLPEPKVALPTTEDVEALSATHPTDVQQLIALQAEGVEKRTYQIGGLRLVLSYLDRIDLIEIINQHSPRCPHEDGISDGTAIATLVINRLFCPCALSNVADWVEQSGLHLLLGVANPQKFNYDRLVDALLLVHPHWQEIAAEVTLRAVSAFGVKVETVHYDLTSVLFHGEYEGSSWVDYGYSRDHRPDKAQINIGLSATVDGEVVLPGGCDIHPGNTNDGVTTVPTHQRLRELFKRSDLLITGDRIMQTAGNMLTIARAGGRFLGPVCWTPAIRKMVANCDLSDFELLSGSSQKAGYDIKGTFRRLPFKVREELSPKQQKRIARWRKKRGVRGRTPKTRMVHFWMRAVIILDTERQKTDASARQKRIKLYQNKLDWVKDHLNKGKYYRDPDWVTEELAHLCKQFKDVQAFVKVTFSKKGSKKSITMSLTHQLKSDKIDQAAKLDGRWMLVTNQPPDTHRKQSTLDYLDWMLCVYKNHRHIERRMRNLKTDLSIRPIYAHRDEVIIPLCFVCVLALMVYTLIERDCQANPALVEAGLASTDKLLSSLSGHCLTVFDTPSGYQVFWFDTPTDAQVLIWNQFELPNPGDSPPIVRQTGQRAKELILTC